MYRGKFAFKNRLGKPSSWKEIYRFSLFYFVFDGNFQVQAPRGAYIWRGDLTEGFLRYRFGGLIFGGAYTWMGLFSEFNGTSCQKRAQTVIILFLFFRPMKLLSL